MAIATKPNLPDSLYAGDTFKVLFSGGDFPAPDWGLDVYFSGKEQFSVAAEDSGADHLLTLDSGDTAARTPGVYTWAAVVSNEAGERQSIASGNIWIKPNPETGVLTYAEECLQLIEAHIKGRLPAGLASHTIAGNAISKISIMDAEKLRDKYRGEVYQELRAAITAAGGDPNSIQIEFTRP